ncbi:MAG TPA: hypothetical protein VHV58_08050 [Pseudolabrys sp.]|nr:hypothetical protein [Pseudolabrys sp.]
MRRSAVIIALVAAFGLVSAQSFAQSSNPAPKKPVRLVGDRGHTVFTSRDEDGRSRTKIIVQKRSYLDPGTEVLGGSQNFTDYARLPTQTVTGGTLNSTLYGQYNSGPQPFELESKNNVFGW